MPPFDQAHSTGSGQARWFAEEVQPHEPALRAYLQARFPSLSDHDDIVQESYVRLLRAQAAGHVRHAKAFLFTTARNAALDLFRRRRVVPMEPVTDFKQLSVLEEQPGVAERADQQYELDVLADAVRGERARHVPLRRLILGMAAAVAVAALGWWQWVRPEAEPRPAHYATSAGGYERVLLADGSVLELNANTEVRVDFAPHERRVRLIAGEAHFRVAHDSARQFVVGAGDVSVRAVGTAFNVRLASAAVEVLVTEGKVQVDQTAGPALLSRHSGATADAAGPLSANPGLPASGSPTLLAANERLVIPTAVVKGTTEAPAPPVIEKVASAAIREALAWQERKLVFAETPLRDVVAQFNRRNRLQVKIGDAALAERPVGGTFAADNVEGFVRLLEGSGTIAVERRGEFEIVLRQVR